MWLYRYVFRGLGVVLVIGMITSLALAIHSQLSHPTTSRVAAPQR